MLRVKPQCRFTTETRLWTRTRVRASRWLQAACCELLAVSLPAVLPPCRFHSFHLFCHVAVGCRVYLRQTTCVYVVSSATRWVALVRAVWRIHPFRLKSKRCFLGVMFSFLCPKRSAMLFVLLEQVMRGLPVRCAHSTTHTLIPVLLAHPSRAPFSACVNMRATNNMLRNFVVLQSI